MIDHVGHPQFGGDVTFQSFHESLMPTLEKAPSAIPSTSVRLVMIEEYHKQYGIAKHDNPDRPLSLVAMHDAEDPVTGSLLVERLKEFADLDVRRIFGLSITEFLALPHDMCEQLIEICRPRRIAEQKAMEKGIQDLTKANPAKQ